MQMFNQEIAPALALAEQRAYFRKRLRINLPALGRARRAGRPPRSRVRLSAGTVGGSSVALISSSQKRKNRMKSLKFNKGWEIIHLVRDEGVAGSNPATPINT